MPVQTVIKHRRSTAAEWTSANPILASGELGLETDTSKFKFGNGTSTWTALAYSTPDYTSSVQHAVKAAESITKGQAVYISSANGTNMLVSKASNAAEPTSSKTVGLLTSTLSTNGVGNVISEGLLAGLNTSTATAGDPVWLGTAGNLIYGLSGKPVAPAHLVFIGIVTRAHATQGEIFVKVQNGFELEELHNVAITSVANKQVLQYDSATSLWKNTTISAGVTVSDTAPSSPSQGDQWYNSAEGRTYVYYDSFWVEASPGIAGPEGPAGVQTAATAPSDTTVIWNDTSSVGTQVLPPNGSKGQVLTKLTDSSFDTTWSTPVGSGNVLINGGFDIWQRGTSATAATNGIYAADRWFFNVSGSFTASQQTTGVPSGSRYCMRVLANGAQIVRPIQFIETSEALKLAGKTVTASVKVRRNSLLTQNMALAVQKSVTVDAGIGATWITVGYVDILNSSIPTGTSSTDWYTAFVTFTIPNDGSANSLRFYFDTGTIPNGGYYEIAEAQLEIGSSATAFKRNAPSLQAELAVCRYYYKRNTAGTAYGHVSPVGSAANTTTATVCFTDGPMRTAPIALEFANIALDDGSAVVAITSASLPGNSNPNMQVVNLTTSAGITQFRPYKVVGNNNTAGYLAISAEL